MLTPTERMATCGHCGHWFGGDCRRFPPRVVPMPSDNQPPITYWPAEWFPQRRANDIACGEWKHREAGRTALQEDGR